MKMGGRDDVERKVRAVYQVVYTRTYVCIIKSGSLLMYTRYENIPRGRARKETQAHILYGDDDDDRTIIMIILLYIKNAASAGKR